MDAITERPPKQFWTPEKLQELRAYMRDGKSSSEVALLMGKGRGSIMGAASRAGFVWFARRGPAEIQAKAAKGPRSIRIRKSLKPVAVVSMAPPTARFLPLLDLNEDHCRWPVCDDPEVIGGQRFCGSPSLEGAPYCELHLFRSTDRSADRSTLQQERAQTA